MHYHASLAMALPWRTRLKQTKAESEFFSCWNCWMGSFQQTTDQRKQDQSYTHYWQASPLKDQLLMELNLNSSPVLNCWVLKLSLNSHLISMLRNYVKSCPSESQYWKQYNLACPWHKLRLLFYNSIIRSVLHYVSSIWTSCDKENLGRL